MVPQSRSKVQPPRKAPPTQEGDKATLALRARARIVGAGYTITRFARENGFSRSTVKAAIRGDRDGKQSKAVLAAIWNLPLPQ